MPIEITKHTGGEAFPTPFIGPIHYRMPLTVDVSTLDTEEVDKYGYIKPGVPLTDAGTLADGTAGEFIRGIVIEPIKIADDNASATLAAADDVEIGVATICQVNRAVIEDILDRALNADEIAAFGAAGCLVVLVE